MVEPGVEQAGQVLAGLPLAELHERVGVDRPVGVRPGPLPQQREERVVADGAAAARAGGARRACRPGRRTSAPARGRRAARSWSSVVEPVAVLGAPARAPTARRTPRTTATRRSRRTPRAARCRASVPRVRLLPNHWCASSWATSRIASQSRGQEVAPRRSTAPATPAGSRGRRR